MTAKEKQYYSNRVTELKNQLTEQDKNISKLLDIIQEKESRLKELEQLNQNLNDDIINQNSYINQLEDDLRTTLKFAP